MVESNRGGEKYSLQVASRSSVSWFPMVGRMGVLRSSSCSTWKKVSHSCVKG